LPAAALLVSFLGLMLAALSLHAGPVFYICMVCYKKQRKKKRKKKTRARISNPTHNYQL
jgi:hypothetical protein